jgi:hypothetical protein
MNFGGITPPSREDSALPSPGEDLSASDAAWTEVFASDALKTTALFESKGKRYQNNQNQVLETTPETEAGIYEVQPQTGEDSRSLSRSVARAERAERASATLENIMCATVLICGFAVVALLNREPPRVEEVHSNTSLPEVEEAPVANRGPIEEG